MTLKSHVVSVSIYDPQESYCGYVSGTALIVLWENVHLKDDEKGTVV